jgi:hypothetical protein
MNSRDGGRLAYLLNEHGEHEEAVYLFKGAHGVCDVGQLHGHVDEPGVFIDDCPLVEMMFPGGGRHEGQ